MFLLLGTKIFVQFAQKTEIKLSVLLLLLCKILCIMEVEIEKNELTLYNRCDRITQSTKSKQTPLDGF